jgi:pimeloyl-ACP methyl ester carboxylesterase
MSGFEEFQQRRFELLNGIHINARVANGACSPDRPALFLLHGFPQTHVCWRRVAQQLQDDFFLVLPDLRGYGDSAQPPGAADHSNYSKRAMATDIVALAGGQSLMLVLQSGCFWFLLLLWSLACYSTAVWFACAAAVSVLYAA